MHSNRGKHEAISLGTQEGERYQVSSRSQGYNDKEPEEVQLSGAEKMKYWTLIVFLFLIYYGVNSGVFACFMVGASDDTESTLIAFGVCFLLTVIGIVLTILWGRKNYQNADAEEEGMLPNRN